MNYVLYNLCSPVIWSLMVGGVAQLSFVAYQEGLTVGVNTLCFSLDTNQDRNIYVPLMNSLNNFIACWRLRIFSTLIA